MSRVRKAGHERYVEIEPAEGGPIQIRHIGCFYAMPKYGLTEEDEGA